MEKECRCVKKGPKQEGRKTGKRKDLIQDVRKTTYEKRKERRKERSKIVGEEDCGRRKGTIFLLSSWRLMASS